MAKRDVVQQRRACQAVWKITFQGSAFGIAHPDTASTQAHFGGDFKETQTKGMNLGLRPLRACQSQTT